MSLKDTTEIKRHTVNVRENIKNVRIVGNYVLIKPYFNNASRKTASGIELVPPGWEDQTNHVDRIGKAVKVPEKLYFNDRKSKKNVIQERRVGEDRIKKTFFYKKVYTTIDVYSDQKNSMPWKTDIEIQEGDDVLFNFQESVGSMIIMINDEKHYLIKYSDCYAIKRNGEIKAINGYLVCEEVVEDKKSELDHVSHNKFKKHELIAQYIGKPIEKYFGESSDCNTEINKGDIIFRDDPNITPTTEYKYHAEFFPEKKEFVLLQRRYVLAVINKN